MNRHLQDVAAGKTEILVLQMPVQHGKTTLGSVGFSGWLLGTGPERRIMALSHTQAFARDKIGAPTRALIEQHGERLFDIRIDRRSDANDRFNLAGHGGGLITNGVDGKIEGNRIDFLVLDDIIGSLAEADNATYQEWLYEEWYKGQVVLRMAPGAGTVVSISRWTQNDFVGRLIADGENGKGPKPVVLDLPAIALEPHEYADGRDPMGRAPGEALWPEVRNIEFLEKLRARVGERFFSARLQQRPGAATGNFFKKQWFRYYRFDGAAIVYTDVVGGVEVQRTIPFARLRIRQYIDLAASLKKEADYFVLTTIAVDPATSNIFVLNVVRGRFPGPEQEPIVVEQFTVWRPGRIKIEVGGYQLTFMQALQKRGLPVLPITRGKADKAERAVYAATRYESGAIFHPQTAGWLKEWEDELLAFPRGHDDQVDTIADAANDLLELDGDDSDLAGVYRE